MTQTEFSLMMIYRELIQLKVCSKGVRKKFKKMRKRRKDREGKDQEGDTER